MFRIFTRNIKDTFCGCTERFIYIVSISTCIIFCTRVNNRKLKESGANGFVHIIQCIVIGFSCSFKEDTRLRVSNTDTVSISGSGTLHNNFTLILGKLGVAFQNIIGSIYTSCVISLRTCFNTVNKDISDSKISST